MTWHKDAISDGEIDALHKAAHAACNNDTQYPQWHGSHANGAGECHNMARWLVGRLGGHVGVAQGHYVWLSPDRAYTIDLTGHHTGHWTYEEHDGTYRSYPTHDNERTARFTKRADRIFDSLDHLLRLSLDYAGDAYPAEQPQASDDSDRFNDSWQDPDSYWHDEPASPQTPEGLYQFVYANGQLEVSPNHSHAELAGHAGIDPSQHHGPFAAGHVSVTTGQATWEAQSNVNLHSLVRILKDATKSYGWQWGGLTDASGQPVNDAFAPKGASTVYHYVFGDGHLLVGRGPCGDLVVRGDRDMGSAPATGRIVVRGTHALVSNVHVAALPSLFEFADDHGLTLYAGNDNVIKTIPDLQEHDNYDPDPATPDNPMEQSAPDEGRLNTGLFRCPACSQLFPNWHEYQAHRRDQESWGDPDRDVENGDRGFPQPDPGQFGDGAHFTEMRQEPGITTGKVAGPPPKALCPTCHGQGILSQGPPVDYCPTCEGTGQFPQLERIPPLGGDEGYAAPAECVERDFKLPIIDSVTNGLGPVRQGRIVVLPARTWREAARVDGFTKYATAFNYDNDNFRFYVAYRNGDPLGYAVVQSDGGIQMVHSAVEGQGIGGALHHHLTKHYDALYTNAAHAKTERILQHLGWVQSAGVRWRWSKDQAPTDMLDGIVPFIYDVKDDTIAIGHPGARTSDIPGKFTPGGIVEGTYEPGGKVVIRSLTSIPYTVRHMIELWYYTQPNLEVKSVHLQDDAGKDTRLASSGVGTMITTRAAMDPAVQGATTALTRAGGQVFAVGGAVRDAIMGKEPHDIDLMVSGIPAQRVSQLLEALPGRVDYTGKDFGVFRYRVKGHEAEIALPRRERSSGAGHQDFDVQADHTMTPAEDFARRDFSANAIGVNLATGEMVDPYGGAADIASGTLRALSPTSLAEDPLRVVRAVVAHAKHGLTPDAQTRAQMTAQAHGLHHLPAERIQGELDKLMASPDPAAGVRLAHDTGVLSHILPEVDAAFGYDQNNPHHELELGQHLVNVLDRTSRRSPDPDLRLAALLHDIGKPASAWQDPVTGSNHFYEHHSPDGTVLGADHEKVGAELADARMRALKYPTDRTNRVTELVRNHMWPAFSTDRGARRFLHRVSNHADDLMTLRWADQGGKSAYPTDPTLNLDTQQRLIDQARRAGAATTTRQLAINGNDLIDAGIVPGPQMGQILNYLTQQVIDNPQLNTRDTLLSMATASGTLNPQDHDETHQSSRPTEEALAQGVRRRESQKLAQGDEEAQVEPQFPSPQEAQEIHDQSIGDFGQAPAPLLNPGGLESGMGRAANYWHYGEGSPGEKIADSAGALAHGIGQAQAFEDGNKRAAYHTTRYFLHNNGYGHLSPVEHDDEELADHLIGHGEGTHSLQDTQQLFRSRLNG